MVKLINWFSLRIMKLTPPGVPSGSILECKFNDLKLFLHRHGSNHKLSPSVINYRANIDALKQLSQIYCHHL